MTVLGLNRFTALSLTVVGECSSPVVVNGRLLALQSSGPRGMRFSSCSTWAQWLCLVGLVALWHVALSWIRGRTNACLLNWQVDSLPLSHQGSLNFPLEYIKY